MTAQMPLEAFRDLAGRLGWDTEQDRPGGQFRDANLQSVWDQISRSPVPETSRASAQAALEPARAEASRAVLSDVDPVVLQVWKLQGRTVGAMLRDAQTAVEELQELLQDWDDAYAAFKGAFDTPQMRRHMSDEYSRDARKRLRDFNEALQAARGVAR